MQDYPFNLPKGWLDNQGQLHQQGRMRLATGADEFAVQRHLKVLQNPYYGALVLLSRVVTQLGEYTDLSPELFESLFIVDSVYLQQFYNQINREVAGGSDHVGE